ncbi:MAG: hypothetical protein HRT68_16745 [Flavobacteriaceae bacterium]|nr:hypothetical protein [Flavobacteriaceae bacterium]
MKQLLSIKKRIENDQTKLFKGANSLFEAQKYARQIRSYYYEVFHMVNGKKTCIGYAVPK